MTRFIPVPPNHFGQQGSNVTDHMRQVRNLVVAKGWRDRPVKFCEAMALLHTEVSEAVEEYRKGGLTEYYETFRDRILRRKSYRPTPALASELADVYIRLLDDCDLYGVDLVAAYHAKMTKNWTRPHRHGGKKI